MDFFSYFKMTDTFISLQYDREECIHNICAQSKILYSHPSKIFYNSKYEKKCFQVFVI